MDFPQRPAPLAAPARLLALGDLHGALDVAVRLVERHRPDALFSPGDWGDPGALSVTDWETLLARVPVYTVFGNHDDPDLLAALRNADGSPVLLTDGAALAARGLRMAGLSGIWAKSHRQPYYRTDEDVDASVAAVEPPIDLLLSHGCPLGVVDLTMGNRHGGQACFLRAFKTLQPRLYVCGHLHRKQAHRTRDGALLLNTGDGRRGDHFLLTWNGTAFHEAEE